MEPRIVARCGDLQDVPESTLPAFESAIAKGADGIEFDVHLTRDEALVIHHDYYLGRTSDGSGYVGDYCLAELRELDVGSWFGPAFVGERMPILSEVLELGRDRVRFEIDMRSPNRAFLQRVLDEIRRFGAEEDVELTSSHVPLLSNVKQMRPALRIGLFFRPLPDWMERELGYEHVLGWMRLMGAEVAHLPFSLLGSDFVWRLQQEGFLVHGANLNTRDELREGILAGIDQFSTDRLEMALEIRSELGRHGNVDI
jgi:glycerophosphoryl diester phosphodiesterase